MRVEPTFVPVVPTCNSHRDGSLDDRDVTELLSAGQAGLDGADEGGVLGRHDR
jgi:hypothetical protein